MENFTKKRGLFVVAAALLIVTAMLGITWCSNDISSNGNNTDEYTPPPGKGAVRLNFDKKIARTILPDDATLDDFDEFDFVFTATGGTATSLTKDGILPGELYDPIVLDPGIYALTVIAYIDSVAMAKNDPAVSVTITAAKTISKEIVLKPYDQTTGTGNGTFKYEITGDIDDEDIISAVMNLTPIVAGALQSDIDISGEFNDGDEHELSVKAGDYYLDVVVEVASYDTVTFRHIVHVYQNMTSSYVFIIDRDYFNAVFQLVEDDEDIVYEGPDDNLPLLSADGGITTLAEGAIVEVEQGDTVTIEVTNDTDFDSFEWYSQDDSILGTSFSFDVETGLGDAFHAKKTYRLTVVGVIGPKKYATFINIKVVEP